MDNSNACRESAELLLRKLAKDAEEFANQVSQPKNGLGNELAAHSQFYNLHKLQQRVSDIGLMLGRWQGSQIAESQKKA